MPKLLVARRFSTVEPPGARSAQIGQDTRRRRPARGPASVGALTTREAEVAALVAKGHTNRMIAAQLSLSERTVETHIRHICTRLDVSSRTAIAVAFTRASIAE